MEINFNFGEEEEEKLTMKTNFELINSDSAIVKTQKQKEKFSEKKSY